MARLTAMREKRDSQSDKANNVVESDWKKYLEDSRVEFHRKYENIPKSDGSLDSYELVRTIGTGSFGRVILVKRKKGTSTSTSTSTDVQYYAMKVMEKQNIVRLKQVEHILNEKKILFCLNHPFTVKLEAFFKDFNHLYFSMEYVPGGEMFRHLRGVGKYKETMARFYAGQVILAVEYLHNCQILYRDLKPENILYDERGYIRLTDFGFAKLVKDRTYTLCGTPEYLAPEVILSKAYGRAVDFWAAGVLIYEMVAGRAPFRSKDTLDLYEKIVEGRFEYPVHFSTDIRDLIKNFLQTDITKRLGNMKNGIKDVKDHKWFNGFDWNAIMARKVPAPHIPKVKGLEDTSNFEEYEEQKLKAADKDRYTYEFRDF